ncbi:uncharacterized protein LOC135827115 [Sycon ciliatum]|uniref:uncharacterized protein LOC135827115 n=1 Tax=Sycon ciliatum TaxID=27933 RepID=UPI0031F70C00
MLSRVLNRSLLRFETSSWSNLSNCSSNSGAVLPQEHQLLTLPVKYGGLALADPVNSIQSGNPVNVTDHSAHCRRITSQISRERDVISAEISQSILSDLPQLEERTLSRIVRGNASGWLMVLPLKREGYDLSSTEFRDQLAIHYASLVAGKHHWYYSPHNTTIDRASMACEDMGTRLMMLDEVLEIRNSIPEIKFLNIAGSFVWALNPVTSAPLAVRMMTEEQTTSMLIASILCKSSPKLEEKGSCWTNDKFNLFPTNLTTYYQAVASCDYPQQDNSIIPFPFLHYCLDSLTRWTTTYHSYWMLKQNVLGSARSSDLHQRDVSHSLLKICWIKRPSPHLTLTVNHECQNYELYYIINATVSHYSEAVAQCGKGKMKLPLIETKECLSLFVKKLGILPAWIFGIADGLAKTSSDSLPVPTSHLKSVICAKERTWNDVKHECGNSYDLFYIEQGFRHHSYDGAEKACRDRNMALPEIGMQDCLFRFLSKLAGPPAWINGKQGTIAGRMTASGVEGVLIPIYPVPAASIICAKQRPRVHTCARYDLYRFSQEATHLAQGAKARCGNRQMALPESRTDQCLLSFLRILGIRNVNNVWIRGDRDAYYSNPVDVICVKHLFCDVPTIANAKADKTSVKLTHNVTYSCNDDLPLVGNPSPRCQGYGTLTSVPVCDTSEYRCVYVP